MAKGQSEGVAFFNTFKINQYDPISSPMNQNVEFCRANLLIYQRKVIYPLARRKHTPPTACNDPKAFYQSTGFTRTPETLLLRTYGENRRKEKSDLENNRSTIHHKSFIYLLPVIWSGVFRKWYRRQRQDARIEQKHGR